MSDAINSQVENREARRLDVAPHVAFPTRILLSLTLLATFVRAAHAQAQGSFGIGGGTAARRQRPWRDSGWRAQARSRSPGIGTVGRCARSRPSGEISGSARSRFGRAPITSISWWTAKSGLYRA